MINDNELNEMKEESTASVWSFERQLSAQMKAERKKKRRTTATALLIAATLFTLALALLVFIVAAAYRSEFKPKLIEKRVFIRESGSEDGVLTIQEIASTVTPSTVGISASSLSGTSIGTGIIYSADGYIITNAHVVSGTDSIEVITCEGTRFKATLTGYDDVSDIAVIKIDPEGFELTPATFGDSDTLIAGDDVIAIGNPAGLEFSGTITTGIVSSNNREISIYADSGLLEKRITLIQNSAAIYPGNSGGPLIDLYGRVVGINTMRFSSEAYTGIGFAIPINGALEVVRSIIDTGSYSGDAVAVKGVSLGISGTAVVKGRDLQIDSSTVYTPPATGVLIVSVGGEETSAYGVLKEYDIILSIDGTETKSVEDIRQLILNYRSGQKAKMKVFRDGQTIDLVITFK